MTHPSERTGWKWVSFPHNGRGRARYPKHEQDILYVVEGSSHSEPYVVRGMRCWDGNYWWWSDEEGEYSETGNDGTYSHVTAWMPTPKPPRRRKKVVS